MKKKLLNGLVIETDYLTMVDTTIRWYAGFQGEYQSYSYTIGLLNQSREISISYGFAGNDEQGRMEAHDKIKAEAKNLEEIFLNYNKEGKS